MYTLFYTKILWNCYSGLFDEMKNYIHRHDDSKISMKLYAELSVKSINYLLQKNLVVNNQWKVNVLQSLNEFALG